LAPEDKACCLRPECDRAGHPSQKKAVISSVCNEMTQVREMVIRRESARECAYPPVFHFHKIFLTAMKIG
jgi:hypothetical protein